ncbi:hypothetical protein MMC29_006017 [Sticta canariensis]|nr:hypothetical protein [Sticta canariensis]
MVLTPVRSRFPSHVPIETNPRPSLLPERVNTLACRIRQLKNAEAEAAAGLPALSPAVAGLDNPFAFRSRLPRRELGNLSILFTFLGRAVLGSSKVTVYKSLLSLDNLVQDVGPELKRTQDEADLAPFRVALDTEKAFKVEDVDGVLVERGFLYFRPGFCLDRA